MYVGKLNYSQVMEFMPQSDYPEKLRRIQYIDPQSGNTLVFLTNIVFYRL